MPTLGPTVRALRRAAGLDQQTLAERVDARVRAQGRRGFSVTYLSKIEHDRVVPPSVEALDALAIELGTDAFMLTALAGQVPPALERLLLASPAARAFAVEALRAGLSEADWERLGELLAGCAGAREERDA